MKCIPVTSLITGMLLLFLVGCSKEPKPIDYGKDACDFCKMTIVDKRFGGEIVSNTGKPFKFDDAKCITGFIENKYLEEDKVLAIYLTDYITGELHQVTANTQVIHSESLKSPMGSNVAFVSEQNQLKKSLQESHGNLLSWSDAIRQMSE